MAPRRHSQTPSRLSPSLLPQNRRSTLRQSLPNLRRLLRTPPRRNQPSTLRQSLPNLRRPQPRSQSLRNRRRLSPNQRQLLRMPHHRQGRPLTRPRSWRMPQHRRSRPPTRPRSWRMPQHRRSRPPTRPRSWRMPPRRLRFKCPSQPRLCLPRPHQLRHRHRHPKRPPPRL